MKLIQSPDFRGNVGYPVLSSFHNLSHLVKPYVKALREIIKEEDLKKKGQTVALFCTGNSGLMIAYEIFRAWRMKSVPVQVWLVRKQEGKYGGIVQVSSFSPHITSPVRSRPAYGVFVDDTISSGETLTYCVETVNEYIEHLKHPFNNKDVKVNAVLSPISPRKKGIEVCRELGIELVYTTYT